ncbi:MAG: phage holin family protein [Patescibacteria group bacterium]|jgi:putative membrane protein
MRFLINLFIYALAVFLTSLILPGVHTVNFFVAFLVALLLGIVNATIKPILVLLTLPINILTLGLFVLIINALLVLLVAAVIPGFNIDSFAWAFLFGIVLSIISWILNRIF